jgi:CDP-diacylglycerol--glycerol-3-phosphate 3-phosphatidyltransferase
VCEFLVKRPETFTDFIRLRLKKFLDAVGVLLNKSGLHPNVITIIGLCGNITAAVFVALGKITIGGLIVLVAAPLDAFDGSMARARGEVSNWGAFVDSVSDRYSELLLLGGLSWYFISCNDHLSIIVTYLAACGAVFVSYIKARAESLGYQAKIGLLSRLERYLVLIPCLVINQPRIAIWILAIFSNFTALQRIYTVRRQVYSMSKSDKEKNLKRGQS